MSLSCTVNEILSLISAKFQRSRDISYIPFGVIYNIMHVIALLCINQQTKFEVPIFTIFIDMIEPKFINGSRDHALFKGEKYCPSSFAVFCRL